MNEEHRKKSFNFTKNRQAMGNLLYLAFYTRTNILYSVSKALENSTI